MKLFPKSWAYSIGLALVWAAVLTLALVLAGPEAVGRIGLVFGGFCIAWISTTIARYRYPPPKRRRDRSAAEPATGPDLRHDRTEATP